MAGIIRNVQQPSSDFNFSRYVTEYKASFYFHVFFALYLLLKSGIKVYGDWLLKSGIKEYGGMPYGSLRVLAVLIVVMSIMAMIGLSLILLEKLRDDFQPKAVSYHFYVGLAITLIYMVAYHFMLVVHCSYNCFLESYHDGLYAERFGDVVILVILAIIGSLMYYLTINPSKPLNSTGSAAIFIAVTSILFVLSFTLYENLIIFFGEFQDPLPLYYIVTRYPIWLFSFGLVIILWKIELVMYLTTFTLVPVIHVRKMLKSPMSIPRIRNLVPSLTQELASNNQVDLNKLSLEHGISMRVLTTLLSYLRQQGQVRDYLLVDQKVIDKESFVGLVTSRLANQHSISITDLAREFEVQPISMRNALMQLWQQGFLGNVSFRDWMLVTASGMVGGTTPAPSTSGVQANTIASPSSVSSPVPESSTVGSVPSNPSGSLNVGSQGQASTVSSVTCKACGKPLLSNAVFCVYCGTKV